MVFENLSYHFYFICSREIWEYFLKQNSIGYMSFKACVSYFEKTNVFLHYFERSTVKRNLTYSCLFFPLFHKHLFSPRLPRATRLLETSWLEKITVCVIETMLVTLPPVQMNKARREVNRTNQGKLLLYT